LGAKSCNILTAKLKVKIHSPVTLSYDNASAEIYPYSFKKKLNCKMHSKATFLCPGFLNLRAKRLFLPMFLLRKFSESKKIYGRAKIYGTLIYFLKLFLQGKM